jgi:hypothetical protein
MFHTMKTNHRVQTMGPMLLAVNALLTTDAVAVTTQPTVTASANPASLGPTDGKIPVPNTAT